MRSPKHCAPTCASSPLVTNTAGKEQGDFRPLAQVRRPADSRHLANRVEREVVERWSLRCALPIAPVASYYRLKGEMVRQEDAEPLGPQCAAAVQTPGHPWDDAQRTRSCGLWRVFAPGYRPSQASIDERWIDAPVRPGKAPGAFAHPTVPSAHPYVLLNYQGKPRDVMTLAHELSHGVHQVLAARHGALMAHTPLTLAETASVFGEMLTFRTLLATTTDRRSVALLASEGGGHDQHGRAPDRLLRSSARSTYRARTAN